MNKSPGVGKSCEELAKARAAQFSGIRIQFKTHHCNLSTTKTEVCTFLVTWFYYNNTLAFVNVQCLCVCVCLCTLLHMYMCFHVWGSIGGVCIGAGAHVCVCMYVFTYTVDIIYIGAESLLNPELYFPANLTKLFWGSSVSTSHVLWLQAGHTHLAFQMGSGELNSGHYTWGANT